MTGAPKTQTSPPAKSPEDMSNKIQPFDFEFLLCKIQPFDDFLFLLCKIRPLEILSFCSANFNLLMIF